MAKQDVESEVTGNVWKVLKSAGDSVAEGEVIMILESMKMEIPVEAPSTMFVPLPGRLRWPLRLA